MNILNFMSYYVTEIIMLLILIKCYGKLTRNYDKKVDLKKVLSICIISLILVLNNLYNIDALKIIITFLFSLILAKIFFNDNWKKTIFNVTIYILLCMIIEILGSIILMNVIKNINYFNTKVYAKCLMSLIVGIILLLIYNSKRITEIINKLETIITEYFNYYTFILIIYTILSIVLYINGRDTKNNPYIIIYEILNIIFIIYIFRIIINDKYNNKVLMEKNKDLNDSYKACSEVIEEYKEFKHNLKNDLFHLKANVPKENQKEINGILTKYNEGIDWVNKINCIPEGIQGIIFLKIKEAKTKNIKVYLNTYNEDLKVSEKEFLNISNIIGILLDNAIEATLKTDTKIIYVDIIETKKTIKIAIMNKFKNTIDLKKIGNKNYSTKEYKSGLGLNYINKIKKNKVKVYFKIVQDLFIATVECNKKDN